MKSMWLTGCVVALIAVVASSQAQEMPEMPKPQKEHQWLEQLAGDWDSEMEASMGPGQPALKCEGTQSARIVGGRWLIAEGQGEMMGQPMTSIMTLGYDPKQKKYIGTFLASCDDTLWEYVGTVDQQGKKLTLETEGPNVMLAGKTTKYREVIELKGKDEYVFTSSMQGEDGEWMTFMTANYQRKK